MSFQLGRRVDDDGTSLPGDEGRLEYDPKHLRTHGLVFGMTGSGKTGLCIGMLEEAGRTGVPVIAIDLKGDITNLALAWPDLGPEHFAEWVDPSEVADGADPAVLGEERAAKWTKGLAGGGITPADITDYRGDTRITVYTPGSSAGVPVSLLDRFDPPQGHEQLPAEDRAELISGLTSALLGLVDIDADPIQSKEAILISAILTHAWDRGRSVDLRDLIRAVAEPPFASLGVFDLDEFYPERDRKKLAMRLNGLVASPSFAQWLQGEPLDVEALLTREGPSQTSVFYLAHLEDSERMAFVTLLLERVVAWMRTQPGTSDLRALVFMDEVFGYLPPHPKNPPSKRPILTLLKQARAFGVWLLLATQNPVDVDYKALTNAGTWWIGKLQTDQDKERILDGLISAASGQGKALDRSTVSSMVSGLAGRQFLMSCAHEEELPVFFTRWVMSYLRGPLTRLEVTTLKERGFYNSPAAAPASARQRPRAGSGAEVERRAARPPMDVSAPQRSGPASPRAPSGDTPPAAEVGLRPSSPRSPKPTPPLSPPAPRRAIDGTPPGVRGLHLDTHALSRPEARAILGTVPLTGDRGRRYHPSIFVRARLTWHTADGTAIDGGPYTRLIFPLPFLPSTIEWLDGPADLAPTWLRVDPEPGIGYGPVPEWMSSMAAMDRLQVRFTDELAARGRGLIPACPPLDVWGRPGEDLATFKARVGARLQRATQNVIARHHEGWEAQRDHWDARIAELRERLEMDQRELKWLRDKGEAQRVRMAEDGIRLRMTEYKAAQRARAESLLDVDSAAADAEFASMDKLEACQLVQVTLQPSDIAIEWFGMLWVPTE